MNTTTTTAVVSNLAERLDALRELTTWHLANRADCGSPDRIDSIGALWLQHVRDDVCEIVESLDDDTLIDVVEQGNLDELNDDGAVDQLADAAVPIYTRDLWATFVDVAAYNEDASELGADGSDMEQAAKVCLYIIAERLAWDLLDYALCDGLWAHRWSDLLDAATELGERDGRAAAEWWEMDTIGGRAGDAFGKAVVVLQEIEAGDPAVFDGLPSADLSGEMADTMTPSAIADILDVSADVEGFDELCEAYELAFNTSAVAAVSEQCLRVVTSTVVGRCEAELATAVADGAVPAAEVTRFADLHDYMDANVLGGLTDLPFDIELLVTVGEAVQAELDAWIAAGGLL